MKQKFKRFMAGFLALMTVFTSLFSNSSTAFAASESANIAFWYASVKNTGEVSELKPGYNHAKILYSIIDGNAAYCMNFGLAADGGQLMNSYDNPSTDLSDAQEKLLSYCLYYGFNSTSANNKRFVRYAEGAEIYSMSVSKFMQLAKDAKACYKVNQLVLVNLDIIDRYLETFHIIDDDFYK